MKLQLLILNLCVISTDCTDQITATLKLYLLDETYQQNELITEIFQIIKQYEKDHSIEPIQNMQAKLNAPEYNDHEGYIHIAHDLTKIIQNHYSV